MCDGVTLLYSRKLTEHDKQTIMGKIKINKRKKKEFLIIRRGNQKMTPQVSHPDGLETQRVQYFPTIPGSEHVWEVQKGERGDCLNSHLG